MWDRKVVEKLDVYVGEFVVACSFRSVADDFTWAFAGVYGPNFDFLRSSLWNELAGLSSWWELPVLGVISMSLAFLLKGLGKFVLTLL